VVDTEDRKRSNKRIGRQRNTHSVKGPLIIYTSNDWYQ
jgi:hypothetical protein